MVKPGRGKVRQKEQWRRSAERRQGSVGPVCCWVMCSAPKLCPRVVRECGHRRDARPETPDPTNLGNRDHLEAPRSLDFTETFRLSGFDRSKRILLRLTMSKPIFKNHYRLASSVGSTLNPFICFRTPRLCCLSSPSWT